MQKPSPLLVYIFATLFVLSWWSLAFKEEKSFRTRIDETAPLTKPHELPLSTLSREAIEAALKGDPEMMLRLIQEWQLDAELLELSGVNPVKKLSKEQYLHAIALGRHLLHLKEGDESSQFLPQTFASASILLALSPHEEIVAIPKGIRELTTLYPKSLTDQIPLNAERDFSEKHFLKKPDIAFVSNYSHPAALEALKNQGIALFTLPPLDTVNDILDAIEQMGEATKHPLKGELLKIFVEATFLAIDNRIDIPEKKRVLFLTHMNHFSLPGKKTLTGQLLTRLGIPFWGPKALLAEKTNDWAIPLSVEQIANYRPDTLIISAFEDSPVKETFFAERGFEKLPNAPVFIDEAIQTFPSQFIALAYYDLAKAFLESEGKTL